MIWPGGRVGVSRRGLGERNRSLRGRRQGTDVAPQLRKGTPTTLAVGCEKAIPAPSEPEGKGGEGGGSEAVIAAGTPWSSQCLAMTRNHVPELLGGLQEWKIQPRCFKVRLARPANEARETLAEPHSAPARPELGGNAGPQQGSRMARMKRQAANDQNGNLQTLSLHHRPGCRLSFVVCAAQFTV